MVERIVAAVSVAALWGCAAASGPGEIGEMSGRQAAERTDDRRYLLERVDDAAVVQVYADGFEKLPREQRVLVWHLYQAAVAGRDIYLDQRYRHNLALRDLLEETLVALGATGPEWEKAAAELSAEGLEPATVVEIRRYARLFWIHSGPFNQLTSRKFVLRCPPQQFAAAVKAAEKRGARLPNREKETTDQLLARVNRVLFDPAFDSVCTNKTPGEGKDILLASANNLYENVSLADLQGFTERYALNSKLVKKRDGKLAELVYRAGFDQLVPPGLHAERIAKVIGHLEDAIPYAPPRTARALGALIRFYKTGSDADFREYCIAWVADQDSPVDTVNGFIEVYLDPRGVKGAWEGIVSIDDPEKMDQIRKFSQHAQWFEDRMPFAPEYRKPQVKGISAKAVQVVVETGDSGPITPIGINLPNPQDIREKYGSKSVSLGNVVEAYEKSTPVAARREFCWDDLEFARSRRWKTLCDALTTNMHEVIGHASGRASAKLEGDPATHIKEYYSALEEARADLVSLCFIGDPKLRELGLVDDVKEVERTEFEGYTRNALTQLNRMKEGAQLEEDHMRNRQMIVHWLMANTNAIEVRQRHLRDLHSGAGETRTWYCVVDVDAWRDGARRLLAEVQRIKSEGDYAAAKKLFDDHGIRFDPKLRDEVVARYKALDLPSYTGFVMPRLTPVKDAEGRVVDALISYPCDLETQMLEWSGRRIPRGGTPAATN
jgi:dipeptidyl-peptidase-3